MLFELLGTVGLFAAFIAALTQNLKGLFGLKGRVVFFVSLGLGVLFGLLFAAGGLMEFKALRGFPDLLSGAVTGFLSGWGASGGKDFLTGIGRNNAKARAEYDAQYRQEGGTEADPSPDEWQEVDLATYSRTDWPATQATEDPNYIAQDARAGWDFDPRQ